MKTSSASPTAYSYLRFSKKSQEDGDSVRRQTMLREGWLKRNPSVRLDTSLTFEDRGVSGFRGKHRTQGRHALAQFLDLVERGRVLPGSYLIVENLDRLTREEPVDSIPAVLSLVKSGVRIVQLDPVECVYDADMDQGKLMLMLWELSRGNGESKRKSQMNLRTWEGKRADAYTGKPIVKKLPAWLELADGQYRVKADAGRTVRLIFKWSAEGLGAGSIVRRLIEEGIPAIGSKGKWWRSYVVQILGSRSVIGEYQPRGGRHGAEPVGDPIPNYFPAVISEAEWYASQSAIKARHSHCGRPASKGSRPNLFAGLLYCAVDDCRLQTITARSKKALVSARAANTEPGSHYVTFPHEALQSALLSQLVELKAADLFSDPAGARLADLTAKLGEVERRLKAAIARFEADPESPTWSDRVSQYDREKRALIGELAEVRREASCPASAAWSEAVELMAQEDPVRLRAALLQTIDQIRCIFHPLKYDRLAAVQVFFREGQSRLYLLSWERGWVMPHSRKEPSCWVRSIGETEGASGIDLRKARDVKRMQKILAKLGQPSG